MSTVLFIAESDADIDACYPAYSALRPHLRREEFIAQVRRQQQQSFQILALRHDGAVKSVAGFRFFETTAWGKILYVDDLSTQPADRARGFASRILDSLVSLAKERDCSGVHLDTGYARHAAHRLYLRNGFQLDCHHMCLKL